MPWHFKRVVRGGLLVLGGLLLLGLGSPFIIEFIQRRVGNRYPGTAQQAGAVYLLGSGKYVATSVVSYHLDHGHWPATLSEVIQDGWLTKEQVHRYPISNDLPDRRDILKMKDFEDWIYIKPQETSLHLPMVVAPRPYTSSMGKFLPKPRRIVVDSETVATSIEEEKIAPVLRELAIK